MLTKTINKNIRMIENEKKQINLDSFFDESLDFQIDFKTNDNLSQCQQNFEEIELRNYNTDFYVYISENIPINSKIKQIYYLDYIYISHTLALLENGTFILLKDISNSQFLKFTFIYSQKQTEKCIYFTVINQDVALECYDIKLKNQYILYFEDFQLIWSENDQYEDAIHTKYIYKYEKNENQLQCYDNLRSLSHINLFYIRFCHLNEEISNNFIEIWSINSTNDGEILTFQRNLLTNSNIVDMRSYDENYILLLYQEGGLASFDIYDQDIKILNQFYFYSYFQKFRGFQIINGKLETEPSITESNIYLVTDHFLYAISIEYFDLNKTPDQNSYLASFQYQSFGIHKIEQIWTQTIENSLKHKRAYLVAFVQFAEDQIFQRDIILVDLLVQNVNKYNEEVVQAFKQKKIMRFDKIDFIEQVDNKPVYKLQSLDVKYIHNIITVYVDEQYSLFLTIYNKTIIEMNQQRDQLLLINIYDRSVQEQYRQKYDDFDEKYNDPTNFDDPPINIYLQAYGKYFLLKELKNYEITEFLNFNNGYQLYIRQAQYFQKNQDQIEVIIISGESVFLFLYNLKEFQLMYKLDLVDYSGCKFSKQYQNGQIEVNNNFMVMYCQKENSLSENENNNSSQFKYYFKVFRQQNQSMEMIEMIPLEKDQDPKLTKFKLLDNPLQEEDQLVVTNIIEQKSNYLLQLKRFVIHNDISIQKIKQLTKQDASKFDLYITAQNDFISQVSYKIKIDRLENDSFETFLLFVFLPLIISITIIVSLMITQKQKRQIRLQNIIKKADSLNIFLFQNDEEDIKYISPNAITNTLKSIKRKKKKKKKKKKKIKVKKNYDPDYVPQYINQYNYMFYQEQTEKFFVENVLNESSLENQNKSHLQQNQNQRISLTLQDIKNYFEQMNINDLDEQEIMQLYQNLDDEQVQQIIRNFSNTSLSEALNIEQNDPNQQNQNQSIILNNQKEQQMQNYSYYKNNTDQLTKITSNEN
ncbi:hypothetical protein PPERSA_00586 [Pseudocohnilembus persalinus]|uniref:Transmembrane protein n=1 Tax=Pseudocohnilembus persalinus TaxID=266149 RepID=A0A0V0QTQ2_PSEPJ|nr:hypothetical protein PPERSA_00586 [Pseudocohnilembus persalinus]|eukprot:KRX05285.1 hypothetical protein PPERSA_00586 [Pseudocohnilembus persalinus]